MKAFYFLCGFVFLWSCNARSGEERVWKSIEKDLQTQLITSTDSTTIELPEGNFMFTRSLLLDGKSNITIKGAGIDKTVLSFAMQEEGAEGLKISNASSIVLEDFTIQDAKGDNIKVTDTEGITFRRVKSEWTGEPKATNGAYAFYPVLSKHVIVEECVAIGASDAGIYVGQSDSVIIRNNTVYFNVAGIESENSRWVEIYGNETYDNTGGILVFDLPGLTQTGHTTRVYDNKIYRNNYKNFAPEGNIVATVPPGTGLMLLATRNIEIFDNEIIDNQTVGIAIASYDLVAAIGAEGAANPDTGIPQAQQAAYIPYYNDLYIHHNKVNNSYWFPTLKNDFGLLFLTKFPLSTPDIVIDGITGGEELRICLEENGEASFANLDAGNDFAGLSRDIAAVTCLGDVIPPVFP